MRTSRITDDMFARIPALLLEDMTKVEIAAMYGVTLGTLVVLCSQRGISLRKGGPLPKRTNHPMRANLTLPDEPIPLSDGVLISLREATRAMGKDSTARLVAAWASLGEGQMISHQAKKMNEEALRQFRDRFQIPVSDEQLKDVPFVRFADDSPEMKYLREHRTALGGYLPARRAKSEPLEIPPLSAFGAQLKSTGDREISTTMAFVRILTTLLRDKAIGKRIVPIVPDESRTFGMEGMFRQFGIFSQVGQLYRPQDADELMFYREDKTGQILQEGINEPGAMASWIAAATSYSTSNTPMIPFYIYYSMFGFQRIGDLAWAAGDMRARGFLIGGTSGRTTLNGEGLQHEDGHSHIIASTIPNCVCYDPTYSYEVAVIVQDGLRRMYSENEDVFYYITTLNENYPHGDMPEGAEDGIRRGMYKLKSVEATKNVGRVRLLGSGAILREVEAGAALLAEDFGIASDIWSVTSFMELRRDGLDADRWNVLHPTATPRLSYGGLEE